MTPDELVEEFAKAVIEHIRDRSVRACDAALKPPAKHRLARRWQSLGIPDEAARVLIADVVDECVFNLFDAIDNGLLSLSYRGSDGSEANLVKDGLGEMGGNFMYAGYRDRYCAERYVDDTAADDAEEV